MSLIDRPNFLSILILLGVILIAGGYGVITYTQSPDLEHYRVDPDYDFGFNFDRPDQVVKLPKELQEISGLTSWKSDVEVLAVQDEAGVVFVLNTMDGKIQESFEFGKDRDYEGIARVDDDIYVLERDGDIHHSRYQPKQKEVKSVKLETRFSYRNDTEGICYDPATGSLLIVPKEQELNPTDEDKYRHGIYAYNLKDSMMRSQPICFVDELAVGQAIYGKPGRYNLKPSGIAVDPITEDIYVLAAVGNILVVINRESQIKHIELLKEKVFRQPEGITFNASGDLLLSSEGRGGKGVLVTFIRRGQKKKATDNE